MSDSEADRVLETIKMLNRGEKAGAQTLCFNQDGRRLEVRPSDDVRRNRNLMELVPEDATVAASGRLI